MPIYPIVAFCCLLFSSSSFAAASGDLNLENSAVGYIALILFSIAYILVMLEEYLKMRKSKPVLRGRSDLDFDWLHLRPAPPARRGKSGVGT